MATIEKFEDLEVWKKQESYAKMIMGLIKYLKKTEYKGMKFI